MYNQMSVISKIEQVFLGSSEPSMAVAYQLGHLKTIQKTISIGKDFTPLSYKQYATQICISLMFSVVGQDMIATATRKESNPFSVLWGGINFRWCYNQSRSG
jgi:hypothetical protein